MRKILKPLRDYPSYSSPMAKAIYAQLNEMIYAPLVAILSDKENLNVKASALVDALHRGVIEYRDGYFVGNLKASVSREIRALGGKWNGVRKVYYLEISRLPQEVLQAIAYAKQSSQDILDRVNKQLREIEAKLPEPMNLTPFFGVTLTKLGKQFHITTKPVTSADLEIPFNPKFAEELEEAYTMNLNYYIKNWQQEAIVRLRQKMTASFMEGRRAENLLDIIQSEKKVSYNKAKFLARQETGLLTAKYREIRYKDIGIESYVWSTSHDERVRPDHAILNGHIFRFDDPPVTDQRTGARNNPTEDYNCLPEDSRIDFTGVIEKCFRRWYSGELTTIITSSGKTIRATPNHPVLTINGWKPIGLLNDADQLIDLGEELRNSFKADHNNSIPTVGEIFESHRKSSLAESFPGEIKQFHGDGSNGDINVINTTRDLSLNRQFNYIQGLNQFLLSLSNFFTFGVSGFNQHNLSLIRRNFLGSNMRFGCKGLSFFKRHSTHSNSIGLGDRTNGDIGLDEPSSDNRSFQPCTFRNGKLAFPRKIRFDDRFWINLNSVMRVIPLRIRHISSSWYNGYVYNFQTKQGYYTSTGVIVSNCRCVAIPFVKGVNFYDAEPISTPELMESTNA